MRTIAFRNSALTVSQSTLFNPLWTPAALGSARTLHLDSQSGVASSGSPARVDSWTDAANGFVLASASGDKAIAGYDFNGKPTPRFTLDGYNSSVPLDSSTGPRGFWLVMDQISTAATQQNVFHMDSFAMYRTADGNLSVLGFDGNWVPGALPTGKFLLVVYQQTAGTGTARVNGSLLGDPRQNVAQMSLSAIRFGRYDPGIIDGAVAEFGLLKGALSLVDAQRMEGYLAHRWGLAGSLPNSHPYKSNPPRLLSA